MAISTDAQTSPILISFLKRFLPNSQAIALAIMVVVVFLLIYFLSDLLMPVFASIVLAYMLDGLVQKSTALKLPRPLAVYLVFLGFMMCLGFLLFVLMPLITDQAVQLVQRIPDILQLGQNEVLRLPKMYPHYVSESGIRDMLLAVQNEILKYGQQMLSLSADSVVGIVTALTYLFLVPMMVFFLLRDKAALGAWFMQFMPRDQNLTQTVWREVDMQIGNYVLGKFTEILILGVASYVVFASMGLNYSLLLAVLMGISVIIPYIGVALVTLPILIVAYIQWGFGDDRFMYFLIAYFIVQVVDGVVLVPLLFSEAVNLHPFAIIVAILLFGGMWGFWGVFFAIPLATVVKALLNAWPRADVSVNRPVI